MDIKDVEAIYPISPSQESLLAPIAKGGPAAFARRLATCEIRGAVDAALLEESLRHIVRRHPALRSLFVTRRVVRPLMVVKKEVALSLALHDLRALSGAEREAALRRVLEGESTADPAHAPLVRLALARTGDDASLCALAYHPLALDEKSARRVLGEVLTTYGRLKRGDAPEPAALGSYGEFLGWLKRQDRSSAEAFWREMLGDRAEPTSLVVERSVAEAAGRPPEEGRRELSL